jgi:hypothetical protein
MLLCSFGFGRRRMTFFQGFQQSLWRDYSSAHLPCEFVYIKILKMQLLTWWYLSIQNNHHYCTIVVSCLCTFMFMGWFSVGWSELKWMYSKQAMGMLFCAGQGWLFLSSG